MRKVLGFISPAFMMALILALLAGCSGAGGSAAPKTYKWGDASFTVKEITDDEKVIGDQKNSVQGKCVAVVLDFGEDVIAQSTFEGNVGKGMMLLDDKKPVNYNYHMSNMVMGSNGFEAQLTGEAEVFFDMDQD